MLPPTWSHANPIDIIGDAPASRYVEGLKPVFDDKSVDSVLFLHAPTAIVDDPAEVLKVAERMPQALNAAGITAALEAAFSPAALPIYDDLVRRGRLSLHMTLAQHQDPAYVRRADGSPDYDLMVARAVAWRDRFAAVPFEDTLSALLDAARALDAR